MKLSEIRPCDACGGKIAPIFYRMKVETCVIDATATNQVLGLNQMFGGHALGLAEVFAPDEPVKTAPEPTTEIILCTDCYCRPDLSIGGIIETRNEQV